jgi:methionyl-tRNA formyltransferase
MRSYKVLYFGSWGYGRAGLEALLSLQQVEIRKVFSKWDLSHPDPYLNQVYKVAVHNGLSIVNSDRHSISKEVFWRSIRDTGKVDFIISCCFDRFFPQSILSFPQIASLNVHPSLLPKYRGVKPLENALANGETRIGVTLHELVKELDAGDIILQKAVGINHSDTYGYLYNVQCRLIKNCLAEFFADPEILMAGKTPQNHDDMSRAPRLPFPIDDQDTVYEIVRKKRSSKYQERRNFESD